MKYVVSEYEVIRFTKQIHGCITPFPTQKSCSETAYDSILDKCNETRTAPGSPL